MYRGKTLIVVFILGMSKQDAPKSGDLLLISTKLKLFRYIHAIIPHNSSHRSLLKKFRVSSLLLKPISQEELPRIYCRRPRKNIQFGNTFLDKKYNPRYLHYFVKRTMQLHIKF